MSLRKRGLMVTHAPPGVVRESHPAFVTVSGQSFRITNDRLFRKLLEATDEPARLALLAQWRIKYGKT